MIKLKEWFGEFQADPLTPREIERHFEAERWVPATWNRYRALLSLTYRLAIRAGKLRDNGALSVFLAYSYTSGARSSAVRAADS